MSPAATVFSPLSPCLHETPTAAPARLKFSPIRNIGSAARSLSEFSLDSAINISSRVFARAGRFFAKDNHCTPCRGTCVSVCVCVFSKYRWRACSPWGWKWFPRRLEAGHFERYAIDQWTYLTRTFLKIQFAISSQRDERLLRGNRRIANSVYNIGLSWTDVYYWDLA